MIDLTQLDGQDLILVDTVVSELIRTTGFPDKQIMLIGAQARNILSKALGHTITMRRTHDVDLALALSEFEPYEDALSAFKSLGSNGICRSVAGIPVDFIPFGAIEDPPGEATPPLRKKNLSVFGHQSVFNAGISLKLPSGHSITLPTPAGYTALKMRAWIDRSSNGQYKDAPDLALACFWQSAQCEDPFIAESLWDDSHGPSLMEIYDFDPDSASIALLSRDVAALLSEAEYHDLKDRWSRTNTAHLIRYFTPPQGIPEPSDPQARSRFVAALGSLPAPVAGPQVPRTARRAP